MEKPEINLPEIRRVLAHIKENFAQFDMCTWGNNQEYAYYGNYNPCNTRACFAGWTMLLNTPESKWTALLTNDNDGICSLGHLASNKAQEILGFTEMEANHVFLEPASRYLSKEEQYEKLRECINKVLRCRGYEEKDYV